MTKPADKIRPASHSSYQRSDPSLREEAEGDLPDIARAPDVSGKQANTDPDALNASATVDERASAFDAAAAAELRAEHNAPNRLGKPRAPNLVERVIIEYTEAFAEHKRRYHGTRDNSGEERYLKAKQAMIDHGLMKGDV